MNRFSVIFLLQFLIISPTVSGQKIIRSSLGCFGSTYAECGLVFRQTAGQPSATDVLKNDAIVLRQGFQQPFAPGKTLINSRHFGFSIAPNPARNMAQIRFHDEIPECVVIVRDLNGTPLYESREKEIQNKWLYLNELKPGIYIVTVTGSSGTGSEKIIVTR